MSSCPTTPKSEVKFTTEDNPKIPDPEKKKRSRFRQEEKDFLVKLMQKGYPSLESKKTSRDMGDIIKKNAEWERLTVDFNRKCKYTLGRSVAEIKKKWENLKVEAKKQSAERKKELFKTGSGVPNIKPEDPLLTSVASVIEGAMKPVESNFDSDALPSAIVPDTHPTPVEPQSESSSAAEVSRIDSQQDSVELQSASDQIQELDNSMSIEEPACPASKRRRTQRSTSGAPKMSTEEHYLHRAQELHEAKMDLTAQKMMMKQEEHKKKMEILDNILAGQRTQAMDLDNRDQQTGCISTMLSQLRSMEDLNPW